MFPLFLVASLSCNLSYSIWLCSYLTHTVVDEDAAGGGPQLRRQQLDDGGLAAAGGPDQEHELAVVEVQ